MPKAILCKQLGPPESLVLEDVPTPAPKDGECVIDVAYSSANFPDTLIIEGKYQSKPDLPFSPGSEMSGVVRAVGPNVKLFKVSSHACTC
jgi:NADPH2:quinone reductase